MKHYFEITEKLPIEFKTKWVEALRSREYEQGNGYLHNNGKFCCLGVSCIMSGYLTTDLKGAIVIMNGEDHNLLDRDFSKIPSMIKGTSSNNKIVSFLTKHNDEGKSFEEIADWIEKTL